MKKVVLVILLAVSYAVWLVLLVVVCMFNIQFWSCENGTLEQVV